MRLGNRIYVSGTTANSPVETTLTLGGTSARCLKVAVLDIIERSLIAIGASMHDMVHTRIFVADPNYCDEVSEAHGNAFQKIWHPSSEHAHRSDDDGGTISTGD